MTDFDSIFESLSLGACRVMRMITALITSNINSKVEFKTMVRTEKFGIGGEGGMIGICFWGN